MRAQHPLAAGFARALRIVAAMVAAILGGTMLVAARPSDTVAAQRVSAGGRGKAFIVVVHTANPAAALPREQVARLFLRKIKRWPNGAVAEPIDLAPGAVTREAFTRAVLGKSVATVRAYWQQRLFSGADLPPPEKASESDALDFVREHPAAVAYVSAAAPLPAGVRALVVTP